MDEVRCRECRYTRYGHDMAIERLVVGSHEWSPDLPTEMSDLDIVHLPSKDGQSCKISVNGQLQAPCALAMVEPCACPEGPYHGAHGVTTPDRCERCGRLTQEQIVHIVWKFGGS